MPIAPEKIADLRLKHLEMIQAIIARMANYSATLKNYCLTLTTAICGFAITLQRPSIVLLVFLPIIILAMLDAQYLRLERRFRKLYDLARSEEWAGMPSMEIDITRTTAIPFARALFSWSVASFYLPLALGAAVVLAIAGAVYGRFV